MGLMAEARARRELTLEQLRQRTGCTSGTALEQQPDLSGLARK